jgi:hypothetical protein
MSKLRVNVKDWGAVGNGTTDDRAAIQAAADFLVGTGAGGVLYFPNGTYLCKRDPLLGPPPQYGNDIDGNSSVRFPSRINAGLTVANITLEGESLAAVIQQDDVYTVPIYFAFPDQPNQGNVTIRNLKFKGNTSAATIAAAATVGNGGAGSLLGFQVFSPSFNLARKIRIENCLFEDGNKFSAVFLSSLEDVLVDGCSFVHFKDYFIATAVTVATTGNITLSGAQTIDGVTLVAGDRVLVKDQSAANQAQNGIYVAASASWSRAGDANKAPAECHQRIRQNCLALGRRTCMISATS